jgi:hypothetical protein
MKHIIIFAACLLALVACLEKTEASQPVYSTPVIHKSSSVRKIEVN